MKHPRNPRRKNKTGEKQAKRHEGHLLTDLFRAYFEARKNKRNTRGQLAFEMDLEHNLIELYEEIRDRTYRPKPCICFIVHRPVKREVFASQFRDRVVHHLLCSYLAPLFDKRMIFDSYSCRKKKGTKAGIERIEHHIRSCTDNYRRKAYILKMDLKGYFMSIDKKLLYDIITDDLARFARKRDERMPDPGLTDFLLRSILFRDPTADCLMHGRPEEREGLPPSKSLFSSAPGTGLPIGDLTSQLFSNIFLGRLDEYVKRRLGCRHYGRYVDDFYIVGRHRSRLLGLVPLLRTFLRNELRLELHPHKTELQPCTRGIRFLGACVKPHRRYPSKRTVRLMRERLAEVEGRCKDAKTPPPPHELERMLSIANSYCGYLRQFRAHRLAERLFGKSPLKRFFRIEGDHRKMVPKKRSGRTRKPVRADDRRMPGLTREERAERDLMLSGPVMRLR
ncbi:MAG: RNA-directed DNA polymerase [Bacteroides heparinolyticus]|nr:RNA-directed DNA polymerase [Bacteroides heparinolyticus]